MLQRVQRPDSKRERNGLIITQSYKGVQMAKYTVGFIGCGNMGGALARAIAGKIPAEKIAVSGRTSVRAEKLAAELGVIPATPADVAANSEWIFLAIKPQVFPDVLPGIAETLKKRNDRYILVSMAAGLKTKTISEMLGMEVPIIRIMPNTPVSVGKGMTLYAANEKVTKEEARDFCDVMEHSGIIDPIEEKLIDAGCSVSGCGPAFVFMFLEAMIDAGVKCGLTREKAGIYAIQTLIGSAELLKESGTDPKVLREAVCSPGGSTIEGVKELEARKFYDAVLSAIEASYEKNIVLGNR